MFPHSSSAQLRALKKVKLPNRTKICFNKHYFDNGVVSRNHAYMLGFLYGDGGVSKRPSGSAPGRVKIGNQFTDIDILNAFRLELESEHYIHISWGRNLKHRPVARIEINDANFAQALIELGCGENKCEKIMFPHTIVPDPLKCDFIRGYFDADGCFTFNKSGAMKIEFKAKCLDFLAELADFISASAGVTNKDQYNRKDKQGQLVWAKIQDVNKILSLMHPDDHNILRMNRKLNRKQIFDVAKEFTGSSANKRKQILRNVKLQESSNDMLLICSFIEMNCIAAVENSRLFGHYAYTPNWFDALELFALGDDGTLREDWKQRTKDVVSNFRYNESLHTVTADAILAQYQGWEHHVSSSL